jgi:uncharacterized integral membrane protein
LLTEKSVTEWIEFIELIAARGRWLVTVVIVAIIVFAIMEYTPISINTPWLYAKYPVYLAGIACAVFLVVGLAIWLGERFWTHMQNRAEARAEDKRALLNLRDIGYDHAAALYWIVKHMGERFWIEPARVHYELIKHGLLIFDDETTRGHSSTYLRVPKVVWDEIRKADFKWRYKFALRSDCPPWTNRIM